MYPVRAHLVASCSSAVIAVDMVESCPWDLQNTKCFIQECVAIHENARIIIPAALSSKERAGGKMLWNQPLCLCGEQV